MLEAKVIKKGDIKSGTSKYGQYWSCKLTLDNGDEGMCFVKSEFENDMLESISYGDSIVYDKKVTEKGTNISIREVIPSGGNSQSAKQDVHAFDASKKDRLICRQTALKSAVEIISAMNLEGLSKNEIVEEVKYLTEEMYKTILTDPDEEELVERLKQLNDIN